MSDQSNALLRTPIRMQLNNGQTSSRGGMPLKGSTATNENRFSMDRHRYVETHNTTTERTVDTQAAKKWTANANRDSSSRISAQRSRVVGYTTKNPHQETFAFTGKNENTVNQALRRVRNKGHVVPPKVVANTNAPIFF